MLKILFLFCQIESELDVENAQNPETLDQYQASAFKETEKEETRKLNKSRCYIL